MVINIRIMSVHPGELPFELAWSHLFEWSSTDEYTSDTCHVTEGVAVLLSCTAAWPTQSPSLFIFFSHETWPVVMISQFSIQPFYLILSASHCSHAPWACNQYPCGRRAGPPEFSDVRWGQHNALWGEHVMCFYLWVNMVSVMSLLHYLFYCFFTFKYWDLLFFYSCILFRQGPHSGWRPHPPYLLMWLLNGA